MSRWAFERDPYLRILETEVLEVGVDGHRPFAVLADTLFYPEGGGQPPDRGSLAGHPVLDVQKRRDQIRHFLAEPPPTGPVRLELDWQRRRDHMEQHTGQHILSAVAEDRFGWITTAFHLGAHTCDIELAVQSLSTAERSALEDAVAAEIRAARSISDRYVTPEVLAKLQVRTRGLPEGHVGEVRLVEIAGLDLNTCGGTHLRSTAEVGALALLGTEPMRGGTRLFFSAGDRVRRRLSEHEERNRKLRSLVGTSDDELPETVAARLEQIKQLSRRQRQLAAELAQALADRLARRPEVVVSEHFQDRDAAFLHQLGRSLATVAPGKAALLTAACGGEAHFLIIVGSELACDLTEVGPAVASLLAGRGGGKGRLFQGSAGDLSRSDEAAAALRASLIL